MILSCPISGGYAYFDGPKPAPRKIKSRYLPIEAAAPLLPIGSRPIATGKQAMGVICYPQDAIQAQQISTMPAVQTIQKEGDFNLLTAVIKGVITTFFVKAVI